MTEEQTTRYNELDKQITALVEEQYALVAPTENENQEADECLWDDVKAEAKCLVDSNCVIGKMYLMENALLLREREDYDDEVEESNGTEFIRSDGRFNTYKFRCEHCHQFGEINIPIEGNQLFHHGCDSGTIYAQRIPRFGPPYLEELKIGDVANAKTYNKLEAKSHRYQVGLVKIVHELKGIDFDDLTPAERKIQATAMKALKEKE